MSRNSPLSPALRRQDRSFSLAMRKERPSSTTGLEPVLVNALAAPSTSKSNVAVDPPGTPPANPPLPPPGPPRTHQKVQSSNTFSVRARKSPSAPLKKASDEGRELANQGSPGPREPTPTVSRTSLSVLARPPHHRPSINSNG